MMKLFLKVKVQKGTFKVSKQGEVYKSHIYLRIINFYFKKLEMKLNAEFQSLWLAISCWTDLFILLFCFAEMLFLISF